MPESSVSVDQRQRQQALDVTGSFIVQAPAGSGKTELLVRRILALLATVRHPEEILAITFTRKAAAEMHRRLLEALDRAHDEPRPVQEHAAQTWSLAHAALARDHERDWALRDNPTRLQVMTIDGFCAALVRRMPYLAGFGDAPKIAEDPLDLYRDAAGNLLARLERNTEGQAAVARLLAHLDNRLPLLRDLVVTMLGRRDQWLRHLDSGNLEKARPDLERALRLHILASLSAVCSGLDQGQLEELCTVGAWAAGNLQANGEDQPLAALAGRGSPPAPVIEDLPVWLALAHLVLTREGDVRKTVNRTLGFPAGGELPGRAMKERMQAALDRLRSEAGAIMHLRELSHLPAIGYADSQWEILAALIELLPLADRELRETFRATGQVDFAEIARGALAALGDDLAPADLLLHLDSRLRHILVDEFQDTSRGQFELLSRLTSGWEQGDGRTLFVVGDPMQSIYRFREAEVGLYLRARARGLETVRLTPVALQANFRSQAGLVRWFNTTFAQLFPPAEDEMLGAVPYAAAVPTHEPADGPAVTLTCFTARDDAAEAAQVIGLIRQAQAASPQGTVAVLVRSRTHLAALVPALKAAGISWQAQEVDPLTARPVIRDLLALTRALLHPADRLAWLSVLRAPWCGLGLDDLLLLCGSSPDLTVWECLRGPAGQTSLFPAHSPDAQIRLSSVVVVLEKVLAGKGRVPLRRLIEAAWLGLNGPAGLAEADLDDAGQFFALLDELDEGGDLLRLEALEERLDQLFAAPDPAAGSGLQLMTVHKAKGLEFDTVILPGLGRSVRPPESSLLLWQEQPGPVRRQQGLLLAPIPASTAGEQDPTYRAIARIHAEKDRFETLRLLYVAVTRARQRLHLLGHAPRNQQGELTPAAGSLLRAAWPALAAAAEAGAVPTSVPASAPAAGGVMLRRLPPGWLAPLTATSLSTLPPAHRRASDLDHAGHEDEASRSFTLRTEEGRIVGSLVHQWLERIARDGVAAWPEERTAVMRPLLHDAMLSAGVPRLRVDACVERAVAAIVNTLRSPRGRWILQAHREAACELALTGVCNGVLVSAVIDRTFVDEQGVRWVIDYKTTEVGEGQSLEGFMAEETGRYRGQLANYRRLLSLHAPQQPVQTALYFPLLDEWREVI